MTGHQAGQALPCLSTCSADSRQDYVCTDSRGSRTRPRRAAAAAALDHSHLIFGSTSPGGITDASPSPLVSKLVLLPKLERLLLSQGSRY